MNCIELPAHCGCSQRTKLLIHTSAENLLLQLKWLGEAGCHHVWQSERVWLRLRLSDQQPLCINLAGAAIGGNLCWMMPSQHIAGFQPCGKSGLLFKIMLLTRSWLTRVWHVQCSMILHWNEFFNFYRPLMPGLSVCTHLLLGRMIPILPALHWAKIS